MAVGARQALDFRGMLAELGRPTVEIALGRPTQQHEGAVAEDSVVERLQGLHERNMPGPTVGCYDLRLGLERQSRKISDAPLRQLAGKGIWR